MMQLFAIVYSTMIKSNAFLCENEIGVYPIILFSFMIEAGNYMFNVNNRSTRTRCGMSSKLTIKTPKRRHCRRSGVIIVNFEYISHLVLVFLLLTLSK